MRKSKHQQDQPQERSNKRRARGMRKRDSWQQRWLKRGLALTLGLLPLVGLEIGLRIANWPVIVERDDPMIGFQASSPLFVAGSSGTWMTTAENRQEFFRPDQFRAQKSVDEFRVFCLGGSTVQGRPYQIETSFTTWLELSLAAADANTDWRVVNCGGVSYASYRLVPILDEVLRYDPDLIVLYTGHNEFLEDRTYADFVAQPRWQQTAHRWARHLHLYQAMRAAWMQWSGSSARGRHRELLAGEVQARLDFQGGLALFERDDDWARAVAEHYEFNLRRMVRMCRNAGVPIVLANPVENLRDCGPFKSQFSTRVEATQTEIQNELEEAVAQLDDDPETVLPELLAAKRRDPRYALTDYLLGQCFDRLHEPGRARMNYEKSRDEDVCPLRMTGPLHAALWRVVAEEQVPCIDVAQLIGDRSPAGIPDHTWLVDHVHPTIEGHQLIAAALHEWMASQGWGVYTAGWEERRDQRFQTHRDSLGFAYFEHGRMRLEGLRQWTRGQAFGALPAEAKIMPRFEGEAPAAESDQ